MKYGLATAQVKAMLAVDGARTPELDAGLAEACAVAFWPKSDTTGRCPATTAWKNYHAGVKHHALQDEFHALWTVLISDLTYQPTVRLLGGGGNLRDPAEPPRRRRTVPPVRLRHADGSVAGRVRRCARSRLALQMASSWPHPDDDDWWAAVDAVLTETR